MEQFSKSTDDCNYFPTAKELNSSKYRRNNRHRKDIIKRMQKEKEKNNEPSTRYFRPVNPIEEGIKLNRKLNNDDPFCYKPRKDRIWRRPNKCRYRWTLKKNDWYVRHHRDLSKKSINKKPNFTYGYIPRPPSYKT